MQCPKVNQALIPKFLSNWNHSSDGLDGAAGLVCVRSCAPHKIRHPNCPQRVSGLSDLSILGFSFPWSPISHINLAFSFLFSQPHTPRAMNSSPVKTEDDYFIVREWFSISISQIGPELAHKPQKISTGTCPSQSPSGPLFTKPESDVFST